MSRLILFNKPYGVLSQFTDRNNRPTLAQYIDIAEVYPAGRLDRDSEGLLLLTDDGHIQQDVSNPKNKMTKTYWVQIEGIPDKKALATLEQGVVIRGRQARPARVKEIAEPNLWQRDPPIRVRKNIPTHWLQIQIQEGRNRQVRRMTAAVGLPTLRLIRMAIGPWSLGDLAPGQWREADANLC